MPSPVLLTHSPFATSGTDVTSRPVLVSNPAVADFVHSSNLRGALTTLGDSGALAVRSKQSPFAGKFAAIHSDLKRMSSQSDKDFMEYLNKRCGYVSV